MKVFHFFSFHQLLVILMIIVSHTTGQTPTISVTPNPVEIGSNVTATCHVTINHAIAFEVNGNQIGSCPIPVGGLKDCSPIEIEQDAGLQQTTWTLPASTVYEGNWTCSRSTTGSSNKVELHMFSCVYSVLSEIGINSDLALNDTSRVNITVEIGCIYPSGNPEITLQFKSGSNQLNSIMNCNAAGTSCTEGTSYECNHQIFFDMLLTNNGEFEFGINYTLHIQVSLSIGDCNSVAIFDQYSLKFVSTGMDEKKDGCKDELIYVVFFIPTLGFVSLTFFIVILLIWVLSLELKCIGTEGIIIVITVDVLFQIILLWGAEYGSNFEQFKSDSDCNVTVIALVCHLVATVLFETLKVFLLYKFMETNRELIAERREAKKNKKKLDVEDRPLTHRANNHIQPAGSGGEVAPRGHRSVDQVASHASSNISPAGVGGQVAHGANGSVESVAAPENIMLLLHFSMPFGYKLDRWVNDENTSLYNSDRYVTNERGTLRIKAATDRDNGIYQSILKSDDDEQRINAVLHVTGQKSVSLMVCPLVWMQIKSKKLKYTRDLKEISRHVLTKNVANIPSNLKKNEETGFSIKSIQWTHNGRDILSPITRNTSDVPPLIVAMKTPIDEYHCTVEFTNKKTHVYIFIVKFPGVKADKNIYQSANKVDAIDEVVGVPTIINTKRNKAMTPKEKQSQDDNR